MKDDGVKFTEKDGKILTPNKSFIMHKAKVQEAPLVHNFICRLARYQHKNPQTAILSVEEIANVLNTGRGMALIGCFQDDPVVFSFISQKTSLYLGHNILFLECFYVEESMRYLGLGRLMFEYIKQYAIKNDCMQIELECPDWNHDASQFYMRLGAKCKSDYSMYIFD